MDMDRDNHLHNRTVNVSETPAPARSSNSLAYIIGGLVVALGLLAFLFYDGNNTPGSDVSTTGSTTRTEQTPGMTGGTSASPTTGATTTTAPTTPTAPARPANPQ